MEKGKSCLEEIRRIGLRIGYFRKVRNITQAELAERLHINKNYLSHIECGAGKSISLPMLIRIARELDVKLSVLVDLDDWFSDGEKTPAKMDFREMKQMFREMNKMNADLDQMMKQLDSFDVEVDEEGAEYDNTASTQDESEQVSSDNKTEEIGL